MDKGKWAQGTERNSTDPEKCLFEHLCNTTLVDFVVLSALLYLELDDEFHMLGLGSRRAFAWNGEYVRWASNIDHHAAL